MKLFHLSFSSFLVALLPVAAIAQSVIPTQQFSYNDVSVGSYTDSPWDLKTNVAVSALTRLGVLRGNDDGTFAPERRLNRAEFVTIVMRLLSDHDPVSLNCFLDVSATAWFAQDVCRAKSLGLIRGNAIVDVDSSLWRFEPTRDIQYEEAVKILAGIYALPAFGDTEGADWYMPYLQAAMSNDIDLKGRAAGDHITRGEMARLTIGFDAWSRGRLPELRNAEQSPSSSSSSRSSSSRSSFSHSSQVSTSTSSSSSRSSVISETVRSHVLVLGKTSPALASVDLFSEFEPVDINDVTVTFTSPVPSISSLIIFDETGTQIGTATAVSGSSKQFHASIAFSKLLLPYREERGLFVEARLKSKDNGGVCGEDVQVDTIEVAGVGRWTTEAYTESSNDTFPASETAFAKITSITNAGAAEGLALSGIGRILADFVVQADTPEALHQVRLTDLSFSIEQAGGVTLSNVSLRDEDNATSASCSVSSTMVTCANIDASIGTVDDSAHMRLVGDVTVPGNADASLRLVLNEPGTPFDNGDITWTDGSATFTWVDIEQPVFRGTVWR